MAIRSNDSREWVSAHSESAPGGSKRWGRGERDIYQPHTTIVGKGETAVVTPVLAGVGGRAGQSPERSGNSPAGTITGKADQVVVAPLFVQRYGERRGQDPRCRSVEQPSPAVVPTGNGASLVGVALHTNNNSRDPHYGPDEPSNTVVGDGARHTVVGCTLNSFYGDKGGEPRSSALDEPLRTQGTENKHALAASMFMAQNNGGFYDGDGHAVDDPASTIASKGANQSLVGAFFDTNQNGWENRSGRPVDDPLATIVADGPRDSVIAAHMTHSNYGDKPFTDMEEPLHTIVGSGKHHGVVAGHLKRDFGQSVGSGLGEPVGTVTADGQGHSCLVGSFLEKYYGTATGQKLGDPLHTQPTVDRFGLVSVELTKARKIPTSWGTVVVLEKGTYTLADICMRMLWPHELYACQGFRAGYIINVEINGKWLTKAQQVRMVGNSVSPPVAAALIRASVPEMICRKELIA